MEITPSAKRLTQSLRDVGYTFPHAVADLVDNSLSAGARRVAILIRATGDRPFIIIADDGHGMSRKTLIEALRFGSQRTYGERDLGKYGLGLKTASISQCRRLTVVSRQAAVYQRLHSAVLDLDDIHESDRWLVNQPADSAAIDLADAWLSRGPGTVVMWHKLDRLLSDWETTGTAAKRRLRTLTNRLADHLSMVFHRYLELRGSERVRLTVNGQPLRPWNPFAPNEPHRIALPVRRFEVESHNRVAPLTLAPYVLPPRDRFTSPAEFDRLAGPRKWNRQQGMYVYRNERLIQGGGWNGLRVLDEHTKLARAAVDFTPELDEILRVNVAKDRVFFPQQLRTRMERAVQELCVVAQAQYRRDDKTPDLTEITDNEESRAKATVSDHAAGLALMAAAIETGEEAALFRILDAMRISSPEAADRLGF